MKKTLISTLFGAAAMMVSCANVQAVDNFSITVPLTADEDDFMAYMIDFDSGEKLDSVIVVDSKAMFKGHVDNPRMVRLFVENDRIGSLILEPGEILFDTKTKNPKGGALNEKMNVINKNLASIYNEYRNINPADSTAEQKAKEIQDKYMKTYRAAIDENVSNPIGFYLFIDEATSMDEDELNDALKKYPQFAATKKVAGLKQALVFKKETSPGHKYKDFEIVQPDGTKKRLSDYVGKGKWTLVDFWASWCGPCIRETEVLKGLLKEYGPKGLEVVGVAVWDEPQNTMAAIQQFALPWPQIINAQTIPTVLYGIKGIPCILLIDPDGNIVSRDKQDEELRQDVANALKTADE